MATTQAAGGGGGTIQVNSAEALNAAKGFENSGDAIKDAGTQVDDAIERLSSFEGVLADAMKATLLEASCAQEELSSATLTLSLNINNAQATFTEADNAKAAEMKLE